MLRRGIHGLSIAGMRRRLAVQRRALGSGPPSLSATRSLCYCAGRLQAAARQCPDLLCAKWYSHASHPGGDFNGPASARPGGKPPCRHRCTRVVRWSTGDVPLAQMRANFIALTTWGPPCDDLVSTGWRRDSWGVAVWRKREREIGGHDSTLRSRVLGLGLWAGPDPICVRLGTHPMPVAPTLPSDLVASPQSRGTSGPLSVPLPRPARVGRAASAYPTKSPPPPRGACQWEERRDHRPRPPEVVAVAGPHLHLWGVSVGRRHRPHRQEHRRRRRGRAFGADWPGGCGARPLPRRHSGGERRARQGQAHAQAHCERGGVIRGFVEGLARCLGEFAGGAGERAAVLAVRRRLGVPAK